MNRMKFIVVVLAFCVCAAVFGAVTSSLSIRLNVQQTKSLDLGTAKDYIDLARGVSYTNGAGANQANVCWHDVNSLSTDANSVVDVNDGSLTNGVGDAVTMSKLKALYIKNLSSTITLNIGGDSNSPLLFKDSTDIISLPPGGEFFFTAPGLAGIDVSSKSELNLKHAGGDAAVSYEIIILGVE